MTSAIAQVQCPACHHESRLEYRRLGSTLECAGCSVVTVPTVPVGGAYPPTGWELRYSDFVQLVADDGGRARLGALLSSFGYSIRGAGTQSLLLDASGNVLDSLVVHLAIQNDEAGRYSLYQTAMSLWR